MPKKKSSRNLDKGKDAHSLLGRNFLVLSPTPTYPLDAGNRKRIYHYCKEFQRRGARIHFVYYPFEWPFSCIPEDYLNEMRRQWDSVYLLPVTKSLQSAPQNGANDHLIDEWWDSSGIEPMLDWLFLRGHYDAFIVNYPYLSRAFVKAPKGIFKILDMHDKFTGRRDLLKSIDIAPDFFYTTKEEEKIALDRADLIWAIKEHEAVFFRTLTDKPVLSMPHCEPQTIVVRRKDPEDEDYLVLGIVGARNHVNNRAATKFIEEVLPLLSIQLAPIKVRVGGSMCLDLEALDPMPIGMELAGRFDQPEDFYSQVDVVLVPVTVSTGLKIKAVEAFALGMPIIAYKHAVEGIPVDHPFHACESSNDLAQCCIDLAFDHPRLKELKRATHETYDRLSEEVRLAFEDTISRINVKKTVVVSVNKDFFKANSLYRKYVLEQLYFLKHLGSVKLFIDYPLNIGFQKLTELLRWQATDFSVIFSPNAAHSMRLGDQETDSRQFPLFFEVCTLQDFCARRGVVALWLLDLPQEVRFGSYRSGRGEKSYLRLDVLRQLGIYSESELFEVVSNYPLLTLISNVRRDEERIAAGNPNQYIQTPCWRHCGPHQFGRDSANVGIWVLSTLDDLTLASSIFEMCKSFVPGLPLTVDLLLPTDADCIHAFENKKLRDADSKSVWSQETLLGEINSSISAPIYVVDVSADPLIYSILQETLTRYGVTWHSVRDRNDGDLHSGATINQFLTSIFKNNFALKDLTEVQRTYDKDAGWGSIWHDISRLTLS